MGGWGGCGNWPNYDAWLATAWGAGAELWSAGPWGFCAANFVFGQNPPYYLDNFAAIYPKFFGTPTLVSGCTTTLGSSVVAVPSVNGLLYGQFVMSANLPPGSVIVAIGNDQITVNTVATAGGATALQTYQNPPVPMAVIQLYLNLAYACLVQARWQEVWMVGMGLFIAHYLTLYAQTDASEMATAFATFVHGEAPAGAYPGTVYTVSSPPPSGVFQSLTKNGLFQTPGVDYVLNGVTITLVVPTISSDRIYVTWLAQQETFTMVSNPSGAQIAAQGLAGGIQTSKSVGDVSVSYTVLTSLEAWGAWNLTKYGQQLATMAKVVGMGPVVLH